MRDELYDREYQAGRVELHAGIDRLIATLARNFTDTFDALHRIEWSAPWKAKDASHWR
jgi:hypothetical protein